VFEDVVVGWDGTVGAEGEGMNVVFETPVKAQKEGWVTMDCA
jgi:hypothetical protein